MFITNSIARLHNELDAMRFRGGRRRCVSLVTARAGLHDGHGAVINAARTVSDVLVVAVLPESGRSTVVYDDDDNVVSATEFHDISFVEQHEAHVFFKPSEETLFPIDIEPLVSITAEEAEDQLSYDSQALIAQLKILNIVQPEIMVWGEKKFIEQSLVRRLIRDLDVRTQVQCVPTVRHANGVPVGDEGADPTAEDDTLPVLFETIRNAAHAIRAGARSFEKVARTARMSLTQAGFEVDHFLILDEETLKMPGSDTTSFRIAARVCLHGTSYSDSLGLTL